MSFRTRLEALSRWQKIAIACGLGLSVYAAFGFLALPPLARDFALESLHETFDRDATVGEVRFNPFLLTLDVERFSLPDRDGSGFVRFAGLHADFELASIVNGAFTFRELRVVEPFVHVKVLEGGALNFADMLEIALAEDEHAADAIEEEGPGVPPLLIHLASIEAGRIVFSDLSHPTDFEHEIAPLDVTVRDFGTRPDDESPYSFKATTGAGESLQWEGSVSAVPLYSRGSFALTGVRPRTGWLYVQDDVFFEVVDGTVDVEGSYDLDARDGLRLRLDEGEIRVRDFAVADRESGASAMSIEALDVTGIEVAYPEQTVHVGTIASRGGRHHALRLEDGAFRISQLAETRGAPVAGAASDREATPEPAATPIADREAGRAGDRTIAEQVADPDEDAAAWSVQIAAISVTDHRIDFEDRSTSPPVHITISPVSLRLDDVRSDLTHPIQVDLELGLGEGRVSLAGPIQAEPPSLDLAVVVEKLDLRAYEPYWLPAVDVDLTSGLVAAEGRLDARLAGPADPDVRFSGDVRVDAFRTLDRTHRSRLVSWSALELSALEVDTAPMSVKLRQLRLVKPAAHLMMASNGSTNFSHLVVESATSPAGAAAPSSDTATPVSIGAVEIVGGEASFEDRTVTPRFQAGLSSFDGRIVGLSSDAASRATVDLEGRLDGTTPMKIEGEVSPLAEETYLDLRLAFENFELSPLTPYSGRHIGQTISRGKLFVDLEYVLDGSSIRGENVLFLDQFTLGERVESDEAVNLPVGLAIALLKDRNGEIRIDLPVEGHVDDPDFSVGKLVFGALGNLITKVALSPFAMLGGLGEGGDETRAITFADGSIVLDASETAKLDALANALKDRPGLVLELTGSASVPLDRPALQAEALEADLRRARFAELQARWFGDKPETIDEVVLEPKDRRRLLERRYANSFGEKPRELFVPLLEVDVASGPSVAAVEDAQVAAWLEQLERSLASEIEIDTGTLRELARQRSQAVRDYMIEAGGIPAERIYMLDVAIEEAGQGDGPRAMLSLAAH